MSQPFKDCVTLEDLARAKELMKRGWPLSLIAAELNVLSAMLDVALWRYIGHPLRLAPMFR